MKQIRLSKTDSGIVTKLLTNPPEPNAALRRAFATEHDVKEYTAVKEYTVGVFEHQAPRSIQLAAYTTWFSPDWKGVCVHKVQALTGDAAKRIAKLEHRRDHMAGEATK